VQPSINEALKDIRNRLKALSNTQAVPVYTAATLPATAAGVQIVYVSDATSGQRFKGWDATAAAWVPLG
jgi:hypothetical protein